MGTDHPSDESSMGHRFMEEMREYAVISFYLWICFGALLLYETSVLRAENVQYLPLSTAAVKALVLGKFILIGKATKVGSWMKSHILLYSILWKSLAFLLLLLALTAIEELMIGLVHGHAVAGIIAEFAARPWLENVAPAVLMLLVLIPMISFEEIDHALGKGTLRRMLFDHPDESVNDGS